MRTLTVRLPEPLVNEIEAESRRRGQSKSDIVRERLSRGRGETPARDPLADVADLIGSVTGLPADLSARTAQHLKATGYGRRRPR